MTTTTTTTEVVVTERVGAVLVVRINRPEAFNALDEAVLAGLDSAVARAAAEPGVRAVVLTGTGPKAFSAGADLKELAALGPDRARDSLAFGQRVLRSIEKAPLPVIAAVNGVALGGGFELALASTFPVLSATASMGLPEAGLGLIPGYGGTQRLPAAVGRRVATHLMLTGARLDAERAYALGLTPVPPCPVEELLDVAVEIAERVAAQGPRAVRSILRAVDVGRDAGLDAGLEMETGLAALAIAGAESTEGISAFLEKRPAKFDEQDVPR